MASATRCLGKLRATGCVAQVAMVSEALVGWQRAFVAGSAALAAPSRAERKACWMRPGGVFGFVRGHEVGTGQTRTPWLRMKRVFYTAIWQHRLKELTIPLCFAHRPRVGKDERGRMHSQSGKIEPRNESAGPGLQLGPGDSRGCAVASNQLAPTDRAAVFARHCRSAKSHGDIFMGSFKSFG